MLENEPHHEKMMNAVMTPVIDMRVMTMRTTTMVTEKKKKIMTMVMMIRAVKKRMTAGKYMPIIMTPCFVTSENHMELCVKITKEPQAAQIDR